MRRRSTLPVVLLLALGAVTACGNDTETASDKPSATPSASASTSASAAPTSPGSSDQSGSPSGVATGSAGASGFPRDRTEATSLHEAVLARNAARTSEEKAVVEAWMTYWQGAADAYYYYKPSQAFTDVATGQAKSSVLGYMNDTKAKKQRVVGWARDNVTKVTVDGDAATIRDCTENFTFTVDEEAEPLTIPPPWYDTSGTLKKVDGSWKVVTQKSQEVRKSCLS